MKINQGQNPSTNKIRVHKISKTISNLRQVHRPPRLSLQYFGPSTHMNKQEKRIGFIALNFINHSKMTSKLRSGSKTKQNQYKLRLKMSLNRKEDSQGGKDNQKLSINKKISSSEYSNQDRSLLKQIGENVYSRFSIKQNFSELKNQDNSNYHLNMAQTKRQFFLEQRQKQRQKQIQIQKQRQIQGYGQKQVTKQNIILWNYKNKIYRENQQEKYLDVLLCPYHVGQLSQPSKLTLTHQLNIIQTPFKTKIDAQTQTSVNLKLQESFNTEISKYIFYKTKMVQELQEKQEKVSQLLHETQQFKKNYQSLIVSPNEEPANQRERRVFGMSKELKISENQVKERLNKITKEYEAFTFATQSELPAIKSNKSDVLCAILGLLKTLHLPDLQATADSPLSQEQRRSRQNRILTRIINKLHYFQSIDESWTVYAQQALELCHSNIRSLQEEYEHWCKLNYENKVLLYNFMKHIQKLPVIMTEMFGYQRNEKNNSITKDSKREGERSCDILCEIDVNRSSPQQEEQKTNKKSSTSFPQQQNEQNSLYRKLIESKCPQCYHTKSKISQLQSVVQQTQPIFRSIEWLIRDMNKKQTSIQFI